MVQRRFQRFNPCQTTYSPTRPWCLTKHLQGYNILKETYQISIRPSIAYGAVTIEPNSDDSSTFLLLCDYDSISLCFSWVSLAPYHRCSLLWTDGHHSIGTATRTRFLVDNWVIWYDVRRKNVRMTDVIMQWSNHSHFHFSLATDINHKSFWTLIPFLSSKLISLFILH